MKKIIPFITVLAFLFSSCQEEELSATDVADIKITMSAEKATGLKSASTTESTSINYGDTVDIESMENINIIFSAQIGGLPAKGDWMIYLEDADNDGEDFKVGNRPYSEAQASICAIKPRKLGLYSVNFKHQESDNSFHFFIRHKGIPGTIGDSFDNDFSFRMEKEIFNISDGKTKIGYSLYLKYNGNDFNSWGSYNGVDPKDENNFKVILTSARNDQFNDGCRGLFSGNLFKLKVCKYSKYVCFTFFEEDFPPMTEMPTGESYRALFYSGKYGCEYWLFPAIKKSDWSDGAGILFTVM